MTAAKTVAEIAASLSQAQRRFITRRYVADRRGYWPMINALAAKGLVQRHEVMTPLGLAVAAYIKETSCG